MLFYVRFLADRRLPNSILYNEVGTFTGGVTINVAEDDVLPLSEAILDALRRHYTNFRGDITFVLLKWTPVKPVNEMKQLS
jgi:hypothetical protein